MAMQLVPYDKQPAGERVLGRQLALYPSFEVPSGTVVVRENLQPGSQPESATGWSITGGTPEAASLGGVPALKITGAFAYAAAPPASAGTGVFIAAGIRLAAANEDAVGKIVRAQPHDDTQYVSDSQLVTLPPVGEYVDVECESYVVTAGASSRIFLYSSSFTGTESILATNLLIEKVPDANIGPGTFFNENTPASGDFTYQARPGGGAQEVAQRVAGWSTSEGGVKAIYSEEWAKSGVASLRTIPDGSTHGSYLILLMSGLTIGETYTFLVTCHLAAAQTGTLHSYARSLYTGFDTSNRAQAPNIAGDHELSVTVKASAVGTSIVFYNGSAGTGVWWDALRIYEGEPDGQGYFDKDTPDADPIHYREEADGTVTKYEQLYTPVDEDAMPSVEVFLSDIDTEVSQVTIWRTSEGRQHAVRGALRANVVGALSRIDYEAPFNIVSTYRAEFFDANGDSMGYSEPASIILESGYTWLHNPLDPSGAVRARALETTSRKLSRPVPGEISYPLGRRVGVVLSEPRRGLSGEIYDVYVDSVEDADKVQGLVGDYNTSMVPVVCIRVGGREANMRIPKPLFLSVLDPVEEDVNLRFGGTGTVHRMEGDEVDPPSAGIFIPLLTRADLNAYYQTRAALDSDNQTRADANRRYDLAGYAQQ